MSLIPRRWRSSNPPPLGGQPGRDRRPLHQGDSGPARAHVGQKHASIRPSWAASSAAHRGGPAACLAASRQRAVNEREPVAAPNAASTENHDPIADAPIKRGDPARIAPWKLANLATSSARHLAVCTRIRHVHHDRLRLDFEHEARWWACSASPALRDTSRRDAFPVGKPANPPRELLNSLEEL